MSDLISRQDAIEAVKARVRTPRSTMEIIRDIIPLLENLPSAEPKKGKWKRIIVDNGFNADWVCSECRHRVGVDDIDYKFCPQCGADMREEYKHDRRNHHTTKATTHVL